MSNTDNQYFISKLSGLDVDSNLLIDFPDNAVTDEYKMLTLKSKLQGKESQNTLMAAFGYALGKATAQKEAFFLSEALGSATIIPHYLKFSEDMSVEEFLSLTAKDFDEDSAHASFSYEELREELDLKTDVIYGKADNINCNLSLAVSGKDVSIKYRKCLYSEGNIKRFAKLFVAIIKGFSTAKFLKDLELQSDEDKALIEEFNNTETPLVEYPTIVRLFRQQAQKTPDKVAVVFKNNRLTYSQLDDLSDRIAAWISKQGIGKGHFVSIMIDRSQWMPVTALGVLKSGAAYQPLDPNYPEERLNFMVKDSGAKALIANQKLLHLLPDYEGKILLTEEIEQLEPATAVAEPEPEDTLILLYTSGTTGTPKGAMLSEKNLVNYCAGYTKLVNLTENSRVAAYASFGFDANMMDTYPTLLCGAELHILAEEIRPDLLALDEYFAVNKITHAFMTTQVGRQFALFTSAKSLKYLSAGGEKLTPLTPPKGLNFFNLYGPTECTVAVTNFKVLSDSKLLPIGKPFGNVKLYVVDSELRPLPVGQAGELCITGLQVGKGYYQRPEKTSQVFITNPFSQDKDYQVLYRTGDIVRWLEDGNIEFIGRRDSQVKIRGFRIELTEVEKVIRDYPPVKDATVAAFDSPAGGKYIAAYVVSDQKIDVEKLNAFIRERKPDYMVPEVTMQLDKIPLTTNQKVNRRALPLPERKIGEYAAPKTDIEEKIAHFVSKLCGGVKISVKAELESAGLTSIGVIQLTAFMKREFNVPLQIADLKNNGTIEKLAAFIGSSEQMKEREKQVFYPISETQKGIFSACLANPDSTLYNIPFVFKLDKKVDVERLKAAVITAVNAHPYLKTILIVNQDGEVKAVRRDEAKITVGEVQVDSLPPRETLVQSFSLTEKELSRFAFFFTKEGTYFFLDIHHIIFDGTSFVIFLEDIEKAYRGEEVEAESYTAFEYALDEAEAQASPKYAEAKAYYDAIFAGLEETNYLPLSDVHEGTPAEFKDFVLTSEIPHEKMKKWCQEHAVSETAVFNTAFGYTLSRYNGTKEAVYATVYNGRSDGRLERSVSMFVKTFPMYFAFSQDGNIAQTIVKTGSTYLDNMAHDLYPFSQIAHDYSLSSDVLFSYQGSQFVFDTMAGKKAEVTSLERDTEKAKMVVLITEEKGKYIYTFSYNTDRYSQSFVEAFTRTLDTVAGQLLDKETFSEIKPISAADSKIIEAFNQTEFKYDRTETVVSLFRKQAKLTPRKTAVVFKDTRISYKALDVLTDKIAAHLAKNGVKKGDAVSILVSRSQWMPVSALGVLKSGAAYQPLDPSYPTERLSFMVEDSGAKIIIAERNLMHLIPNYQGQVLFTDEIEQLEAGFVPQGPSPEDTYILLYTSGTTGKPKGAMLKHSNLINYVHWYIRTAQLNKRSRVAAYASFGFDANMMDTYPTLVTGAELHILPNEIRMDLALIDEYFCVKAITHSFMTTQVGRQYALFTTSKSLKYLSVGGEKLTPLTPPKGINFYNIYGPTECTIAVTNYLVKDDSKLLPIGKAMDNTKLYVVDENLNLLPPGGVGELCIAGFQVGKGYLNRPDKTAETFIVNPFTSEEGYETLYRTGDIVRYLPDGNIDFVGRRDGQVKVRGFRIELTEIEKVIREYDKIKDATVAAFDSPAGGKFVASYIVSDEKISVDALNSFIRSKLPPYMVPAVTMQIEKIPLTVNQKVDRRALPKPTFTQTEYVAPVSNAEEDFCSVFQSVLGLEKVGRDDDFFDLGGSSISAMKVVVEAGKKGYKIAYKDVFELSTPHKLAQFLGLEAEEKPQKEEKKSGKTSDDEGFDYTAINELLEKNSLKTFKEGKRNEVGDVLLAGATGYLGIHVLRELMKEEKRTVWALVRGKDNEKAEERLKSLLSYYQMEDLISLIGKRIIILENNILEENGLSDFKQKQLTVFNCLASVKHFSKGDEIEQVNVKSVENLINWCLENDAHLIHVSTESVAGYSEVSSKEEYFTFKETELYKGQVIANNQYVKSKFLAERALYTAILEKGLKAKVMRVGNLAPRFSDGLFQINYASNGFMKMLKAYLELGELAYSATDVEVDFSPIDCTAQSLVLLATTPDECITFMPSNQHLRHLGNILTEIRQDFKFVEEETFAQDMEQALKDPARADSVSSLMTYSSSKGEESLRENGADTIDNTLTLQILYRLGFQWPLTDSSYVKKFSEKLFKEGFFK